MFLVGKGIPSHITSLPQTVLNTPFGQMLKPQIDRAMRPVVQAPVPPQAVTSPVPRPATGGSSSNGTSKATTSGTGRVHNVSTQQQLDTLLTQASKSSAVIFFTSVTCPPCKIMYPIYDELAAEAGTKSTLVKIDISNPSARPIAGKYSISATPTFMTLLHGQRQDTWTGANAAQLQSNVRALVQTAFPPHPHSLLNLPTFRRTSTDPITYAKIPPLDKLTTKLGATGQSQAVTDAVTFIRARNQQGAQEAPLIDLVSFSTLLTTSLTTLPPETQFAAFDLLRLLLVDKRVSGFFAQPEHISTITGLMRHVNSLEFCPYNLRLTAIHACCNMSTTPLFKDSAISNAEFAEEVVALVSNNLLDAEHASLRAAAAGLAYNLAAAEHGTRVTDTPMSGAESGLPETARVALTASLLEALSSESGSENPGGEAIRVMVLALGLLVYLADVQGEVMDLCRAMEAADVVRGTFDVVRKEDREVVKEVGGVLLVRGLDVSGEKE